MAFIFIVILQFNVALISTGTPISLEIIMEKKHHEMIQIEFGLKIKNNSDKEINIMGAPFYRLFENGKLLVEYYTPGSPSINSRTILRPIKPHEVKFRTLRMDYLLSGRKEFARDIKNLNTVRTLFFPMYYLRAGSYSIRGVITLPDGKEILSPHVHFTVERTKKESDLKVIAILEQVEQGLAGDVRNAEERLNDYFVEVLNRQLKPYYGSPYVTIAGLEILHFANRAQNTRQLDLAFELLDRSHPVGVRKKEFFTAYYINILNVEIRDHFRKKIDESGIEIMVIKDSDMHLKVLQREPELIRNKRVRVLE